MDPGSRVSGLGSRVWALAFAMLVFNLFAGRALAVERFPAPDFRSEYKMPATEVAPVTPAWRGFLDMGMLVGMLALGSWLVYTKRSRGGMLALTVVAIAYFGFWRKGCICPIGATQNVALSLGGNGYALPLGVAAFFGVPILFTLFYGRVFCGGVCPLGAIQDVVLWKPVHLPSWLEHALGLFAYAYLGLAVMYAAIGSDFIICRYDPFIGFFRLSATASMLFLGGVFLLVSMFVGRTYCRFFCPYGVILRLLSPFSKKRVTITPTNCVDCRLCEQACPYGAIRYPSPKQRPGRKDGGKVQLKMMLALLPMLIALFAFLGYVGRGTLARGDVNVRLAERIWQEEHGVAEGISDASKAFRGTGQSIEQLYQQANRIRSKYGWGATLFGAWMGLAIGGKLVALVIRRQRTGYTADPAGCVACARCYKSCPVEIEQAQEQEKEQELVVA